MEESTEHPMNIRIAGIGTTYRDHLLDTDEYGNILVRWDHGPLGPGAGGEVWTRNLRPFRMRYHGLPHPDRNGNMIPGDVEDTRLGYVFLDNNPHARRRRFLELQPEHRAPYRDEYEDGPMTPVYPRARARDFDNPQISPRRRLQLFDDIYDGRVPPDPDREDWLPEVEARRSFGSVSEPKSESSTYSPSQIRPGAALVFGRRRESRPSQAMDTLPEEDQRLHHTLTNQSNDSTATHNSGGSICSAASAIAMARAEELEELFEIPDDTEVHGLNFLPPAERAMVAHQRAHMAARRDHFVGVARHGIIYFRLRHQRNAALDRFVQVLSRWEREGDEGIPERPSGRLTKAQTNFRSFMSSAEIVTHSWPRYFDILSWYNGYLPEQVSGALHHVQNLAHRCNLEGVRVQNTTAHYLRRPMRVQRRDDLWAVTNDGKNPIANVIFGHEKKDGDVNDGFRRCRHDRQTDDQWPLFEVCSFVEAAASVREELLLQTETREDWDHLLELLERMQLFLHEAHALVWWFTTQPSADGLRRVVKPRGNRQDMVRSLATMKHLVAFREERIPAWAEKCGRLRREAIRARRQAERNGTDDDLGLQDIRRFFRTKSWLPPKRRRRGESQSASSASEPEYAEDFWEDPPRRRSNGELATSPTKPGREAVGGGKSQPRQESPAEPDARTKQDAPIVQEAPTEEEVSTKENAPTEQVVPIDQDAPTEQEASAEQDAPTEQEAHAEKEAPTKHKASEEEAPIRKDAFTDP